MNVSDFDNFPLQKFKILTCDYLFGAHKIIKVSNFYLRKRFVTLRWIL